MTLKTGHKRRNRKELLTSKSLAQFFQGKNYRAIEKELRSAFGRYRARRPKVDNQELFPDFRPGAM